MEGGKESKSASTGASDSKRSYSQAAKSKDQKTFLRKINYSIGVVETIHRTRQNAYARVTVGKGEELSLKVDPNTLLRPGSYVQVTMVHSGGKITPSIFGPHRGQIPPEDFPLCRGRVKWLDRKLNAWTIKVRSSAKYLRIENNKQTKMMRDQTIYFVPTF